MLFRLRMAAIKCLKPKMVAKASNDSSIRLRTAAKAADDSNEVEGRAAFLGD